MFTTKIKSGTNIELRDWFAAKFASDFHTSPDADYRGFEGIAEDAYALADTMIHARTAKENNEREAKENQ